MKVAQVTAVLVLASAVAAAPNTTLSNAGFSPEDNKYDRGQDTPQETPQEDAPAGGSPAQDAFRQCLGSGDYKAIMRCVIGLLQGGKEPAPEAPQEEAPEPEEPEEDYEEPEEEEPEEDYQEPEPEPEPEAPSGGDYGGSGLDPDNQKNDQESRVIVNDERAKKGLEPLGQNEAAEAMCLEQVQLMQKCNEMSHEACGQGFSQRASNYDTGYAAAENIAMGQKDPNDVMNSWINSPGHYANIVNAGVKSVCTCRLDKWWAQIFVGL